MWTGLAPWEFEFLFPGSLISTVLVRWGISVLSVLVASVSDDTPWFSAYQLCADMKRISVSCIIIRLYALVTSVSAMRGYDKKFGGDDHCDAEREEDAVVPGGGRGDGTRADEVEGADKRVAGDHQERAAWGEV